jgi:hypothetical protein
LTDSLSSKLGINPLVQQPVQSRHTSIPERAKLNGQLNHADRCHDAQPPKIYFASSRTTSCVTSSLIPAITGSEIAGSSA